VLAAALRARPCAGRTLAVCGMLADKDAVGVAAALAPLVDEWLLAGIHEPRGLDAATLAQRLPADCAVVAQAVDVAAACAAARARAQARAKLLRRLHTAQSRHACSSDVLAAQQRRYRHRVSNYKNFDKSLHRIGFQAPIRNHASNLNEIPENLLLERDEK
jgi:folylpolyglutamate synthase/dihydropteroate synthase